METWRQFRADLNDLMRTGGVTPAQLLASSRRAPGHEHAARFRLLARSTVYDHLKESSDERVARDWESVGNLLHCIAVVAEENGSPVTVDDASWERTWTALDTRRGSVRLQPQLTSHSWIGGWDGAADAVFAHSAEQEFTAWTPGAGWLDSLARSVAQLSAAYQPDLAREAAERLVTGTGAEYGPDDPRTLAARHAAAFWTGQTGQVRRALDLTTALRADCRDHLGADHLLTRLAALREAWWTGHTGRWREANRLYIALVDTERARSGPDREGMRLLARWGMARTGGRAGNWTHAHTELTELLPQVVDAFGAGHPVSLDARAAHAWAAGRAGSADDARALLETLADEADTALGNPDHPTALRIRIGLACWTLRSGDPDRALAIVTELEPRCTSVFGPDHPLGIDASATLGLCLLDSDPEAAARRFDDVLRRTRKQLGADHPFTLGAAANHATARVVTGGAPAVVSMLRGLVTDFGRALGEEHPDTLRVRVNLAVAQLEVFGAKEAMYTLASTVAVLRSVLGDDHPDTVRARDILAAVEEGTPNGMGSWTSRSAHSRFSGFSDSGGAQSDRALKTHIAPVHWPDPTDPATDTGPATGPDALVRPGRPVDGFAVLRAVAALPVSTWNYRGEEEVRHLGPMAQDWYGALGLGPDDRTISLVDVNGVALVAVQALHRMVTDLRAEVRDLAERLDEAPPA